MTDNKGDLENWEREFKQFWELLHQEEQLQTSSTGFERDVRILRVRSKGLELFKSIISQLLVAKLEEVKERIFYNLFKLELNAKQKISNLLILEEKSAFDANIKQKLNYWYELEKFIK